MFFAKARAVIETLFQPLCTAKGELIVQPVGGTGVWNYSGALGAGLSIDLIPGDGFIRLVTTFETDGDIKTNLVSFGSLSTSIGITNTSVPSSTSDPVADAAADVAKTFEIQAGGNWSPLAPGESELLGVSISEMKIKGADGLPYTLKVEQEAL